MLIYVAAPYSNPSPEVVEQRIQHFCKYMSDRIEAGDHVVSPLMNHLLTDRVTVNFPLTWEFWSEYSRKLLSTCDALHVLCLPGWQESTGVTVETELAVTFGIPTTFIYDDAWNSTNC